MEYVYKITILLIFFTFLPCNKYWNLILILIELYKS